MVLGQLDMHMKKVNLNPYITICIKTKSKWITDL